MRKTLALSLAVVLTASTGLLGAQPDEEEQPVVQIALLLDTSNSMDGLISQAKGQLWKIVNEFINARQNGKRPQLQIALFEYGNNGLSKGQGYIRQVQPLTTDLDKISEELFSLKTNGGDEYCGWVIREATEKLAWSSSRKDFKAIFIAGNEPFTQGPIDFMNACKAAIERGIIVNTIHCGSEQEGITGRWRDGANYADGKYMFIDQNTAVVHYDAPQDKEIARLGQELNKTYLPYGAEGQVYLARQAAQDNNALALSSQGSSVGRAVSKASTLYQNYKWDLVDATKDAKFKWESVKEEQLPPAMRTMRESERKAFVEKQSAERTRIQKEISRLNADRTAYVANSLKNSTRTNTLDAVMTSAIHEQAAKKNIQF